MSFTGTLCAELIVLARVYIRQGQLDIAEEMLLRLTKVLRHLPSSAEVTNTLSGRNLS